MECEYLCDPLYRPIQYRTKKTRNPFFPIFCYEQSRCYFFSSSSFQLKHFHWSDERGESMSKKKIYIYIYEKIKNCSISFLNAFIRPLYRRWKRELQLCGRSLHELLMVVQMYKLLGGTLGKQIQGAAFYRRRTIGGNKPFVSIRCTRPIHHVD